VDNVVWELDSVASVGRFPVTVEGAPKVVETDLGRAVTFNGTSDALVVPTNPVAGSTNFTIEVLFRPDADGAPEQRFFHIQEDGSENRVLLETRVTPDGQWYADTFIRSGTRSKALADPALLHPCGTWHTLALAYDGRKMTQYVNGVRELSGAVSMSPLGAGRTSLGMRINKVHWFKGTIRRVRITARTLDEADLLKPGNP
jgi:hypothetical protein